MIFPKQTPHFSPDGATIAISYKPKTSSTPDIALLDWRTRKVRNLTREQSKDHFWRFVAWSPDGKSIYANRANAGFTDADVYRVDVASGNRENLTPHKGQILYVGFIAFGRRANSAHDSNEKAGIQQRRPA